MNTFEWKRAIKEKKLYRPNKVAYHFQRSIEQRGCKKRHDMDFLKLAVRGTLDVLARTRFDIVRIKIEHPTNRGYFKEVYVLKKNKLKYVK